eukprot:XP_014054307.1 PREDICTED: actin filament-associated protein 1-like 1 isoform X2 [Salmo salar]
MDTNNRSMEVLVTELNFLLKLLDHETLSSPTEEKKTSVRNLLKQLQPTVTGPDYLYMNTSVYRHGTGFVESLFETFDCDMGELKDMTEDQKQKQDTHTDTHRHNTTPLKQVSYTQHTFTVPVCVHVFSVCLSNLISVFVSY